MRADFLNTSAAPSSASIEIDADSPDRFFNRERHSGVALNQASQMADGKILVMTEMGPSILDPSRGMAPRKASVQETVDCSAAMPSDATIDSGVAAV